MLVRLTSCGSEEATTQEFTGLQFYNQRKNGEAEKIFFFLSRCHASIISSSCWLGRGVFLSLHGQATSINYCFLCVQRACPNLLSSLGRIWVSCHPLLVFFGCAGSFFSSYGEQGLLSRCGAGASCCRGFSRCGAQALGHVGFRSCSSWAPEHGLSSCSPRA